MTWKEVQQSLTIEDVEKFLYSLGVYQVKHEGKDILICPTICHNPIDEQGSMKLYWYQKNRAFHCYTECGDNMSIFELYRRYKAVNQGAVSFEEAVLYVKQFLTQVSFSPPIYSRNKAAGLFIEENEEKASCVQLPEFSKLALDCFEPHYYHPAWRAENISPKAMDYFNIRFSISQNKIIIPHYDIEGRLVGIRGRAFNEEELEAGRKYTPVIIGDTMYSHQLHFNLYGVYENQQAIKLTKTAVIFEGEKSVIKGFDTYEKYSNFVAACGYTINKYQINLLTQLLGVNNIVLAFDKEYASFGDARYRTYIDKMTKLCKKYKNMVNISFIMDTHNLLKEKDSPIDRGEKVWEQLYKERIKV